MVAIHGAPVVGAPLIRVDAYIFHGAVKASAACDVQVYSTIRANPALHVTKLCAGGGIVGCGLAEHGNNRRNSKSRD